MEKDEGARHAELDLGPHLSAGQRAIAPLLHQALQEVAAHFSAGEDVEIHAAGAARRLREQGFSSVDYLEVHDSKTLALLARADGRAARVFGAARLGTVA